MDPYICTRYNSRSAYYFSFVCVRVCVLGIELRALYMQGKNPTTEPQLQPLFLQFLPS